MKETTDHKRRLALGENVEYLPHCGKKDRSNCISLRLLDVDCIFNPHKISQKGTAAATLGVTDRSR